MEPDERVEIVEGDKQGDAAILWKRFAAQRAFHASIAAELKINPHSAAGRFIMAKAELIELQKKLTSLQEDVSTLKKVWEGWDGPELASRVDGSNPIGYHDEFNAVGPLRARFVVRQ